MKKLFSLLAFILLAPSISFANPELLVTSRSHSQVIPQNAVRVPFLTLNVKAKSTPQQITSITVQRTGLSSSADLERLIAITDTWKRSTQRNLSNRDQATLEFKTPLVVSADTETVITIYANTKRQISSGQTIGLSVLDITSKAATDDTERVYIPHGNIQYRGSRTIRNTRMNIQALPEKPRTRIRCENQRCYRIE